MSRSHKPVIWSLFAAGGTFAAFLTPVMIIVTGLGLAFGLLSAEAMSYDRMLELMQLPIARLIAFVVIFLPAWHAAHRLRITAHDFGIRADGLVMAVCYGLAAIATLIAVFVLFGL